MTSTSQRFCHPAGTLARFVLLCVALVIVAACTGAGPSGSADSSPPPVGEDGDSQTDAAAAADSLDAENDVQSESADPQAGESEDVRPALASVAEGLPGKIVRRTTDGGLVVSAPDGSEAVTWSSLEDGRASQPTWSRDGSQLAWSVIGPQGAALAIADFADGPASAQLLPVDSPIFYFSWSPANDWLAGLRNGPGGLELAMVDVAAQDVRVVGPGQPFYTDWATDDSLVAAIGGAILADVPAASNVPPSQRQIADPLGVFQAPVVLPDGDVIAAVRRGESNVVVRVRGTDAVVIASAEGPVVFTADPLGERLAVLTAPDPNEPEFISFQTDSDDDADTDTDAASLLLEPGTVSTIDLRTGEIEVRPEDDIIALNWSPTGETLAMLEASAGGMTWLFAEPGGSAVRSSLFVPSTEFATSYLPFADQYDRSSTWWSPDGRAFLFAGSVQGNEGIWLDRLDDGQPPAFLSPGDIAFWSE